MYYYYPDDPPRFGRSKHSHHGNTGQGEMDVSIYQTGVDRLDSINSMTKPYENWRKSLIQRAKG